MTGINTLPPATHGTASHSHGEHHEREQVWFIINRAYQNIYGLNLPANPSYQKTVFDAALALRRDNRSQSLDEKIFLQACEDIIRICDEHHRKAEKHAARASNPVYLRETALDNALEKQRYLQAVGQMAPDSAVMTHPRIEGRVRHYEHRKTSSSEIMELAYQQLALGTQKAND